MADNEYTFNIKIKIDPEVSVPSQKDLPSLSEIYNRSKTGDISSSELLSLKNTISKSHKVNQRLTEHLLNVEQQIAMLREPTLRSFSPTYVPKLSGQDPLKKLAVADPDLANADLAERCGVTPATCWRRLERLRANGIHPTIRVAKYAPE